MLTPANVFSSSAHTMAARASVTPLISICPSSDGSSICGTKVSPNLSPMTPDRLVLHYFVQLKGHLHGSQRVLRAWSKHELPNRAPPLPTKFLIALAGKALAMGHTRCAVFLLVAFHAFLRTQELLMVQASHFVLGAPGAPTVVSSYHQIRSTPPGRPGSSGQWRWYFHCVHPRSGAQASTKGTALAAKRSFVFRFFKRLCTDTRLPALSWRPYSLRRGGATAHFLEHGSLDKTAVRGRWPSTKTARVYINEAVSTLAQITLTTLQQTAIDKCAKIILQPDMLKTYFRGRSIPSPAAVEPGSCAVEAAGSGGCSSARSRRSATAAAHTCYVSASAGDHLIPRMRPGPQDHGRSVPTSLPGTLVVVLKKEIMFGITVTSGTLMMAQNEAEHKRVTETIFTASFKNFLRLLKPFFKHFSFFLKRVTFCIFNSFNFIFC